jgi:tRNA (cmo5U34)-methyltransferase
MNDWSFEGFAEDFDSHVREQLPWYELVTESVAYITRNYLPVGGLVYDIGASTGNMAKAMVNLLAIRDARMVAIESDPEMCKAFTEAKISDRAQIVNENAMLTNYDRFDVATVFLTAMFLPVRCQHHFLNKLYEQLREGGAIIIVDKVCEEDGYFSTVMKRLTMYWKLKNGAKPEDIIDKELSLSGVQRPLDEDLLRMFGAKQFFQLGEFKGWVIEK